MAKTDDDLYYVTGVINRGQKTEMQPGTLFVPSKADRDFFLEHEVIRPANEGEVALWEKQNAAPKKAGKPAATAKATAADDAAAADEGKSDENDLGV